MHSSTGVLIKKHVINRMKCPQDLYTENGDINAIRKPFSLFLDHEQNKLYVGTGHG